MAETRPMWMVNAQAVREVRDLEQKIGVAAIAWAEADTDTVKGDEQAALAIDVMLECAPRLKMARAAAGQS